MALLDSHGCPGPLALVFFSMTVSAIAQQPSFSVFVVTSTCAVLLAQLTGINALHSGLGMSYSSRHALSEGFPLTCYNAMLIGFPLKRA